MEKTFNENTKELYIEKTSYVDDKKSNYNYCKKQEVHYGKLH